MQILVDADACPVKSIIKQTAMRYRLPVILFFDTAHRYEDGYSQIVMVETAADSVDFALLQRIKKGDIVVTQDYGLAAMALGRRAKVLHHDGMQYSEFNIDGLLMKRYLNQKHRRSGERNKGPAARTEESNRKFTEALDSLILSIKEL